MDTPPQNNSKYNVDDDFRHDVCQRIYTKTGKMNQNQIQQAKQFSEKDQLQKMQNDLRGQLKYIEETNWMFEGLNNNNDNF
ncbi:unnamed protein product [Paramecium pentaurelia]|uniref:Uncharacterized protein n=1 Tax=Paramecium pentaurelia TaxID=43138 RepID=A0A8S1V7K7_9CILI|nr:unnamed protein product [Paramecium pentaurelia]